MQNTRTLNMDSNKLLPGYYWVKNRNKWTIAEYDKDGLWWFFGNDSSEKLDDDDVIGEPINRESSGSTSKVNAEKELISRISLPDDRYLTEAEEINLKNPLEEFYYYNRPDDWDEDGQSRFRDMLLKALRYVINAT